jgi:hypothetical protein
MQRVPGRLIGVARERCTRVVADFEHVSALRLQDEPVRRKLNAPIECPKASERCPLPVDVRFVAGVGEQAGLAFEIP